MNVLASGGENLFLVVIKFLCQSATPSTAISGGVFSESKDLPFQFTDLLPSPGLQGKVHGSGLGTGLTATHLLVSVSHSPQLGWKVITKRGVTDLDNTRVVASKGKTTF